jgi:hypothetical protein
VGVHDSQAPSPTWWAQGWVASFPFFFIRVFDPLPICVSRVIDSGGQAPELVETCFAIWSEIPALGNKSKMPEH